MKTIFKVLAIALIMVSCTVRESKIQPEKPNWEVSTPPIELTTDSVTFYTNVSYGSHEKQVFDLFTPKSNIATGLVVYLHGGGFTSGSKEQIYSQPYFVDSLLSNNIAFMTMNYRLIESNDTVGVEKSLNDAKKALQYIKYYHEHSNIDRDKVVLMGKSAGAGASLWLGLNDDLKENGANDVFLRESTKPIAIVAIETQATYDLMKWADVVFQEFPQLDSTALVNSVSVQTLLEFYGINELTDSVNYEKFDMLGMIDNNDPDIYLNSTQISNSLPVNYNALLHHPLHPLRIQELSSNCIANIPYLGLNASETYLEFIIRKLN